MTNPNNCAACKHKEYPDVGWCYMFRLEPTRVCAHHTKRTEMYSWLGVYFETLFTQAQQEQPTPVLDGKTPMEFVAGCLYDFQQATGCDTAEQFLAKQPAQKPDTWKTQFLTDVMTSAGLLMYGRTDKKLAQRIADGSARWRTELYTSAPTQPSLSDEQALLIAQATGAFDDLSLNYEAEKVIATVKAVIEAHCRGGANK